MVGKLIGIDLGGMSVKFAIMTFDGEILQKWRIETDATNEGTQIVPSIIESLQQNLATHQIASSDILGIGMGSPGAVDFAKGTVIGAYNLGWRSTIAVKEQIEEALNIPFAIDNDANVAALGELWKGAGEGDDNVVFVTLGTGIGGGVIVNGNLARGASAAGELGHIVIDPDGYECTCGNRGCLETVASAVGIARLATDFMQQYEGQSLLKEALANGQDMTAKLVFDLAKEQDALALAIIDKFSFYLGLALANIANTLNPNSIVIGGGVSAAGDLLLQSVDKYFTQFIFPPLRETTTLKLAQLGNDAGIMGAAWLIREQHLSK